MRILTAIAATITLSSCSASAPDVEVSLDAGTGPDAGEFCDQSNTCVETVAHCNGHCIPICGNSAPDPVSDIPCPGDLMCLTTHFPFPQGQGWGAVRLCFPGCRADGSCATGEVPQIAADGSCACLVAPITLLHGGF